MYKLGSSEQIINKSCILKPVSLHQVGEDKYVLPDGERKQIESLLLETSRPVNENPDGRTYTFRCLLRFIDKLTGSITI